MRTQLEHHATAAIRRRTADAHRDLEDRLALTPASLTEDRYRDLLRTFASLHLGLERAVHDHVGAAPGLADDLNLPARSKQALLAADLAALGEPLPPAAVVDHVGGWPAALGALYVTEGSTLGGQVVRTIVVEALGPDAPVAFFGSYGAAVPARWAAFRRVANRWLDTPHLVDAAASAAEATFARMAEELVP